MYICSLISKLEFFTKLKHDVLNVHILEYFLLNNGNNKVF